MKRSLSLKIMLCWILQKFPSILILESNILSYSLTKAVFNLFLCCAVLCVVAQSCPTLCHLMDCSLPGSSVHGIVQARILEWVAMPSSRESSQPRNQLLLRLPISSSTLLLGVVLENLGYLPGAFLFVRMWTQIVPHSPRKMPRAVFNFSVI